MKEFRNNRGRQEELVIPWARSRIDNWVCTAREVELTSQIQTWDSANLNHVIPNIYIQNICQIYSKYISVYTNYIYTNTKHKSISIDKTLRPKVRCQSGWNHQSRFLIVSERSKFCKFAASHLLLGFIKAISLLQGFGTQRVASQCFWMMGSY